MQEAEEFFFFLCSSSACESDAALQRQDDGDESKEPEKSEPEREPHSDSGSWGGGRGGSATGSREAAGGERGECWLLLPLVTGFTSFTTTAAAFTRSFITRSAGSHHYRILILSHLLPSVPAGLHVISCSTYPHTHTRSNGREQQQQHRGRDDNVGDEKDSFSRNCGL